MAALKHLTITALKDNVAIITAVRKLGYRKIDGLENYGRPDGQPAEYENTHGITLQRDQVIEIDIREDQMKHFQEAVDKGEIEVVVHPSPIVQPMQQMTATTKTEEKAKK